MNTTKSRAKTPFPNNVQLIKINSSFILGMGYQPEDEILYIMLKETETALPHVYRYFEVDAKTFAQVLNYVSPRTGRPSKGAGYNNLVKGKFQSQRVI